MCGHRTGQQPSHSTVQKSHHQQFAWFLASVKWILCGGMNGSILETIIPREKSKHGGGGPPIPTNTWPPPTLLPEGICMKGRRGRLLEAATVLGDGRVQGKKRLTGVLEIFFSGGWFGLRIKWWHGNFWLKAPLPSILGFIDGYRCWLNWNCFGEGELVVGWINVALELNNLLLVKVPPKSVV